MMTCDEFKELAPAYALIALDEDERRACAQHLATVAPHRGCVEAVEQAALVAARLAEHRRPGADAASRRRAGHGRLRGLAGRGPAPRHLPHLRVGAGGRAP